jgi:hypothetical protein
VSQNAFQRLAKLLPDSPVLVGRVLEHHDDDTSTVELPVNLALTTIGGGAVARGSLVRPRGRSVPVGGWAFIRRGVIETRAPDGVAVPISVGIAAAVDYWLRDTFTSASDEPLDEHVMEMGGTWQKDPDEWFGGFGGFTGAEQLHVEDGVLSILFVEMGDYLGAYTDVGWDITPTSVTIPVDDSDLFFEVRFKLPENALGSINQGYPQYYLLLVDGVEGDQLIGQGGFSINGTDVELWFDADPGIRHTEEVGSDFSEALYPVADLDPEEVFTWRLELTEGRRRARFLFGSSEHVAQRVVYDVRVPEDDEDPLPVWSTPIIVIYDGMEDIPAGARGLRILEVSGGPL